MSLYEQLHSIAELLAHVRANHATERADHPRERGLLDQLETFTTCAADRVAGSHHTILNYSPAPAGALVLGDVIIPPGTGPSRGELVEDLTSTPDGRITVYTDHRRAGWTVDPHTQIDVRDETADPPPATHAPVVELVMTDGAVRYCPLSAIPSEIARGNLNLTEVLSAVHTDNGEPVALHA